jgi:hypothetical protein
MQPGVSETRNDFTLVTGQYSGLQALGTDRK